MKIKICGLRQAENIQSLLPLQPDYMGFIFYEKSKRYAGKNVGRVSNPTDVKDSKKPIKTGVFVNEELNKIKTIIERHALDSVQLHGDESPEFCKKIKNEHVEVIKVFSVDDDFDFSTTKKYEPVCDLFLFDTKGKERGGRKTLFSQWRNRPRRCSGNKKNKSPQIIWGGY